MNIEVKVKAAFDKEPVVVRALLANNSSKTQISRRLGKKLGLNSLQDIYVADISFRGPPLKWKISLQPLLITVGTLESHRTRVVYPIINYNAQDAFWDLIIGHDCPEQFELLQQSQANRAADGGVGVPTPGPSFSENTIFMGHNLRIIARSSELTPPPNEFFEHLCFDSTAIKRLAVNRVTQQMVVVYVDSTIIYQYDGVLSESFDRIEAGGSKGTVVSEVRNACAKSTIANFPRSTLLTDGHL